MSTKPIKIIIKLLYPLYNIVEIKFLRSKSSSNQMSSRDVIWSVIDFFKKYNNKHNKIQCAKKFIVNIMY